MAKRLISLSVIVAALLAMLVVPTSAAEASGNLDCSFFISPLSTTRSTSFSFPRVGGSSPVTSYSFASSDFPSDLRVGLRLYRFSLSDLDVVPGGSIGFYLSYGYGSDASFTSSSTSQSLSITYQTADTSQYTDVVATTSFNFVSDSFYYLTEGQRLSFRIDDVDSLISLSGSHAGGWTYLTFDSLDSVFLYFFVPSVSLVYTETSAELDSLESIADQIAAGNDLAQAMYGDIMKALNAIAGDTELMASLINDCMIYLASLEQSTTAIYQLCNLYLSNLARIAATADDINAELQSFHTDFISKLDLLIATISSESDDIQAAMDRIYEQLIAWLETNFSSAINPGFDDANTDLSQGIQNNDQIEQQWTGSLSDSWQAMNLDSFSFDASLTSGFMFTSAWLTNFYNSLGLYGAVLILPLIVGICKLLLGFYRFSGHGGRGDDDA